MAHLLHRFKRLTSLRASFQSTRFAATAAPAKKQDNNNDNEEDVVIEAFKEQQKQYRALMEGSKHLQPPLNGDDAAIKKYATEIEALRKKIGMPEHHESLQARMDYDLKVARYDAQSWLTSSIEGKDFGDKQPMVDELVALSEGVNLEDPDSAEPFKAKVKALAQKHNLDDFQKIKEQSIFDMYKANLAKLRKDTQEEMDTVKRRDHLEDVQVDAGSLRTVPA